MEGVSVKSLARPLHRRSRGSANKKYEAKKDETGEREGTGRSDGGSFQQALLGQAQHQKFDPKCSTTPVGARTP